MQREIKLAFMAGGKPAAPQHSLHGRSISQLLHQPQQPALDLPRDKDLAVQHSEHPGRDAQRRHACAMGTMDCFEDPSTTIASTQSGRERPANGLPENLASQHQAPLKQRPDGICAGQPARVVPEGAGGVPNNKRKLLPKSKQPTLKGISYFFKQPKL